MVEPRLEAMTADTSRGLDNFANKSFSPLGDLAADRCLKPALNVAAAQSSGVGPRISDYLPSPSKDVEPSQTACPTGAQPAGGNKDKDVASGLPGKPHPSPGPGETEHFMKDKCQADAVAGLMKMYTPLMDEYAECVKEASEAIASVQPIHVDAVALHLPLTQSKLEFMLAMNHQAGPCYSLCWL